MILRQTVTRLRAPLIANEYGLEASKRDWEHAESLEIRGCSVQPSVYPEYDRDREAVTIGWKLYAPTSAGLLASDRIVSDGLTYEIEGEPLTWPSPSGQLDHIEAVLKRVVG
jgi:hypothetical protein